jgi:hypothetical protein
MRFNIGDYVRNKINQRDGCIVRIADTSLGAGYIVALDERCGETNREALWREADVNLR